LLLNEQISVIGYMTEPEKGKKIITKVAIFLILQRRDGMPLPPNEPFHEETLPLACPVLLCLFFSCRVSKPAFDPAHKYAPAVLQKDYLLFRHILEDLHPASIGIPRGIV